MAPSAGLSLVRLVRLVELAIPQGLAIGDQLVGDQTLAKKTARKSVDSAGNAAIPIRPRYDEYCCNFWRCPRPQCSCNSIMDDFRFCPGCGIALADVDAWEPGPGI